MTPWEEDSFSNNSQFKNNATTQVEDDIYSSYDYGNEIKVTTSKKTKKTRRKYNYEEVYEV